MSDFTVGQTVLHFRFNYRGVVVAVDETFQGTEEWYQSVAASRPPKDRPWYHLLVDGGGHNTYVAERHLQADESGQPIQHARLGEFFDQFRAGIYSNSGELH